VFALGFSPGLEKRRGWGGGACQRVHHLGLSLTVKDEVVTEEFGRLVVFPFFFSLAFTVTIIIIVTATIIIIITTIIIIIRRARILIIGVDNHRGLQDVLGSVEDGGGIRSHG
jgi:hypothetical protein